MFLTREQQKTPESTRRAMDTFQRCGSEEIISRYPTTGRPLGAGLSDLSPRPSTGLGPGFWEAPRAASQDARAVRAMLGGCPGPARARSSPAPAAARPAGVRPIFRPGSCHSPARPGQQAPTAPHGSWAPRASRFRPAPGRQCRWMSPAAAAPHRPLGPAPGAAHWVRINNKMAASRGGGGRAS